MDEGVSYGAGSVGPDFRDLTRLSAILKVGLWIYVATSAISLWSGWLEIELLQQAAGGLSVSAADAAANDSRQGSVAGVYFLVMTLTGVIFLRWTYLVNRNARSLGATGLEFTPGWAVGWYFVPFATFWKPYQAVKEIFKASHPDFSSDWRKASTPRILPVWWTLWLIGTFVGQAVLRSVIRADTVDELLESSIITFISDSLDIPMAIAAIVMVTKLQEWQSEKRRRLVSVTV